MRISFHKNQETGTSFTKLIDAGKSVDFEYASFIKKLYAGEVIEEVEYDPEEAFDAAEREAISKMIKEITDICNTEKTDEDVIEGVIADAKSEKGVAN